MLCGPCLRWEMYAWMPFQPAGNVSSCCTTAPVRAALHSCSCSAPCNHPLRAFAPCTHPLHAFAPWSHPLCGFAPLSSPSLRTGYPPSSSVPFVPSSKRASARADHHFATSPNVPVSTLAQTSMADATRAAFLQPPLLVPRPGVTTRGHLRGDLPHPAVCARPHARRPWRFLPPLPTPLPTRTRTPVAAGFDDPFDACTLDPTSSVLYLASRRLGDDGAVAVGALLAHPACAVTALNLDSNGIGDAGATALAAGLAANTSLVDLVAWDNSIGDAGASALAAALATRNTTLRVLSLARNAVGPAGGAALGTAVGTNGGLRAVYLMGMTRKGGGMGDAGAAAWAAGIAANGAAGGPFWFVNLDGNGVGPAGFDALRTARTPGVHHVYPVDPYPR